MAAGSPLVALLSAVALAAAWSPMQAQATLKPTSPVSHVEGLAFNRFVNIWLENVDYTTAAQDPNLSKLAEKGVLLNNYWAVTHPSEPNYCASAGGDTFGMDNDKVNEVPANVSTIADLFDTNGVTWGEYQEGMPSTGFQGRRWPPIGPPNYVRKHNPLVLFDSVANDEDRLGLIKDFDNFYEDLHNQRLPQHMFITPNMTNDAHDTNITFAGAWTFDFLSELLENEYFTEDTLILLTFDESDTYEIENRVFSFLLGGAVPELMRGNTDDTFYTIYSVIASLSANWGLPSLGRWDCGANLFSFLAEKTGYINWEVETSNLFMNQTHPGPLSSGDTSGYEAKWPVPLTDSSIQCSAGHGILEAVSETYEGMKPTYNYTAPLPYDSKSGINVGITYRRTMDNGDVETHETK
ncbi:acid phosphatase [Aspergillus sp. HF37]|nr:acid phosphatase [Aspergillus sp. HF37]